MKRGILRVALAATVLVGGCTAAASQSAAPPSASPAVAPPSVARLSLAPATATQLQTIHLILHPIYDTVGSLTGCKGTTCQGDFMVEYDPLFGAVTGKEVGTFAYECFLVDVGITLYRCPVAAGRSLEA
jgi:hypothetical protein